MRCSIWSAGRSAVRSGLETRVLSSEVNPLDLFLDRGG